MMDEIEEKQDYKKNGKRLNRYMDQPLEKKIDRSLNIIERALSQSKTPVISSSFGKDSVVLIHLVHRIDPLVRIVMNNTGVMFPETLEYQRMLTKKWELDVDIVTPKQTFFEIVREHGYPKTSRNTKTGDKREPACCKILKADPMVEYIKGRGVDLDFVGLCGYEGRQRRWAFVSKGSALYYMKTWSIHKCIPLIWWGEEDIWQYIHDNDIPVNPAYEKYNQRWTGCVTCTGHKRWKKEVGNYSEKLLRYILKDMKGQSNFEDFEKEEGSA